MVVNYQKEQERCTIVWQKSKEHSTVYLTAFLFRGDYSDDTEVLVTHTKTVMRFACGTQVHTTTRERLGALRPWLITRSRSDHGVRLTYIPVAESGLLYFVTACVHCIRCGFLAVLLLAIRACDCSNNRTDLSVQSSWNTKVGRTGSPESPWNRCCLLLGSVTHLLFHFQLICGMSVAADKEVVAVSHSSS